MIYPLTDNINFIVKSDMLTKCYKITNIADFYDLPFSNYLRKIKPIVISELSRHDSVVLCPSSSIDNIDKSANTCLLNINTGNFLYIDLEYLIDNEGIDELNRILRIL